MSRASFVFMNLALVSLAGCSTAQKETPQQQTQPAQQQQPTPEAAAPATAPAQQAEAPAAPQPVRKPSRTPEKSHRRASAPAVPSQQAETAPPAPAPSTEPAPAPAPVASTPPVRNQSPVEPPAPPAPRIVLVPAGTVLAVRLQDALDTSVNREGDAFRVLLDSDLLIDGNVVAPRGAVLQGTLTNVQRSGRVQGRAQMSLQLKTLKVGSQSYPIDSNVLSFEAESTKKQDAEKVGIGAGIGAVIGAIAGGGKGAAIGAAVGGGAGGATVAATRGKELKFEPEHRFSFTLQRDVQVRLH